MSTEREADGTRGSPLAWLKNRWRILSVSKNLELRRVREEHFWLASDVYKHKERVKKLGEEQWQDENERNHVTGRAEALRPRRETASVGEQATTPYGASSIYVVRMVGALDPQYVSLALCVM